MATEEEERKAKAERAKKLLATRQKKAKAAAASASSSTTPNLSASPALTDIDAGLASTRTSLSIDDRADLPPPPKGEARRKKVVEQEQGGDVASQGDVKVQAGNAATEKDVAEVPSKEALPVDTQPKSPLPDMPTTPNLQETINSLTAERTTLQTQLAARESDLASAQADKQLLDEGRAIIAKLEADKVELEAQVSALEEGAESSKSLQSELLEARKEADALREKQKVLEEQAKVKQATRTAELQESREKAAGLERSLERFREREGGLEKEVGRLRQRETELKASLDAKSADADSQKSEMASLTEQLATARTNHTSLQSELENLTTTHTELQTSHTAVSTELETLHTTHTSQTERLREAESSLSSSQAELARTTSSLSTERKRAEVAEKKREALQTENGLLVTQLEEVRGKVATVMEEKAELAGELDSAKGQIRKVDTDQTVKTLEAEVQASTSRIQALTRQLADLQSAYTSLQKERDQAVGHAGSPIRNVQPEASPLPRTSNVNRTVDAILPANVRHKRQVSLIALKARMGSSSAKGGMESLAEHPGADRRQFGDEIMFCCPACEGDLITL